MFRFWASAGLAVKTKVSTRSDKTCLCILEIPFGKRVAMSAVILLDASKTIHRLRSFRRSELLLVDVVHDAGPIVGQEKRILSEAKNIRWSAVNSLSLNKPGDEIFHSTVQARHTNNTISTSQTFSG